MGKDWLVIYFYMWSSSFKVFSILEKTKVRLQFHNTWQWYKIQIPAFMKVFFLTLWPHCIAYGILIPWWRIEPLPSILEVWSLNHRASREVSQHPCKFYWHTAILTWNIIHGGFRMTRTGLDSYERYEALCRVCQPASPFPQTPLHFQPNPELPPHDSKWELKATCSEKRLIFRDHQEPHSFRKLFQQAVSFRGNLCRIKDAHQAFPPG